MAEQRTIARIITEGAQTSIGAFTQFGTQSKAQLDRLTQGTTPANAALRALSETSANLRGQLQSMTAPLGSMGTVLTALGPIGLAAGAGIGAVAIALPRALRAASDYERQQLRVNQLLTQTGRISGQTAQSIEALSQRIGRSTLASTQEVRDASAQLLTFRNVTGDAFERVIELSQDLAETGFGSITSSAVRLGKALENPTIGISALNEAGISFSQSQKDVIASMVETGRQAEAMSLILDTVEDQVGGTGVAAAQGYAGALDTLGEELKLTWELLGQTANGTGAFSDAITAVTGVVVTFRDALLGSGDELEDLRTKLESFSGLSGMLQKLLPFLPGQGIASLLGVGPGQRQGKSDVEQRIEQLETLRRISTALQQNEARTSQLRAQFAREDEADTKRAITQYERFLEINEQLEKASEKRAAENKKAADEAHREAGRLAAVTVARFRSRQESGEAAAREAEEENTRTVLREVDKRVEAYEREQREQERLARIKIDRFARAEEANTKKAEEEEKRRTQNAFREIASRADRAERQLQLEEEVFQTRQDLMRTAADNVTLILENVVEDDWIGALDGFFRFAAQGIEDLGAHFRALGEEAGNLRQQALGRTLGHVGGIAGGVGTGVGLGFGVAGAAQQGGLSPGVSGALGGAAGGAVAGGTAGLGAVAIGAAAGSVVPVVGTIIGAAVGAILGAWAGGAFGGNKPPTFSEGIRTTPTAPPLSETSDSVFRRSALGVLSFPEQGTRGIAGFADLETIKQLDDTLAQLLSVEQKRLAQDALANTITGEFSGENFGAAAGDVMAERIATVIQAVIGGTEGQGIAGQFLAIGPRGGPEVIAQKAGEIFGIIATLTQAVDTEKLTAVQQELKNINGTFEALAPVAIDYGFSIDRINEAHLASIAKLREQVDERNRISLLEITDPIALAMERIKEINEQFLTDTIAVGGNIAQAHAANMARLQQVVDQQMAATRRFQQGVTQGILNIQAPRQGQRFGLDVSQEERRREAEAAGHDLVNLERLFQLERVQLARQFADEDRAIRQQQQQERAAAAAQRQAEAQARAAEAAQRRAEALARRQSLIALSRDVASQTLAISNPLKAAFFDLQTSMLALQQQARQLGVSEKQLADIRRLQQLQVKQLQQHTNQQIGGFQQDIQQRIFALQDPIKAELYQLQRSHQERLRQAKEFGVGTARIEQLYQLERQKILEQGMTQNLGVIRDFIRNLTSGPQSPLAPSKVLENARREFVSARGGSDANAFVGASQNYLSALETMFASGPQFAAGFQEVLNAAKAFGLGPGALQGGGGAQKAQQEQLKLQQRQVQENAQQNGRIVGVLVEIHRENTIANNTLREIRNAVRAGTQEIVQAIGRRPKGSFAA